LMAVILLQLALQRVHVGPPGERVKTKSVLCLVIATLAVGAPLSPARRPTSVLPEAKSLSVIVQAADLAGAVRAVRRVGGTITHELGIIDAVGARLTPAQGEILARSREVRRIYPDRAVRAAGGRSKNVNTFYPTLVGADRLHSEGILGTGVTVGVVDTGLWAGIQANDYLMKNIHGQKRVLSRYNGITHIIDLVPADPYGHGTHVTSIIASSKTNAVSYDSIAPNANLLPVTSFDLSGSGTYLDVIRGIDHILRYKNIYNIRVLNLSFSAPPRSYYWDDPLNQAVMRAWRAGIVVVVSAGNTGPAPMTIGVPGNVPYVITVGAMTDNYTPDQPADDFLASFSSTGPTVEGFVKPDVVAPGGHLLALMDSQSLLTVKHAEYHDQGAYFAMSGTSQAAAVVSGIAALLLQREPWLSPDEVKCRLMASARPAVKASGKPAYSVFQQGAGRVDAYAAVYSAASGCANQGLNIDLDLAGKAHYGGPANRTQDGTYYLSGISGDGYVWNGAYLWSGGYLWSDAYLWADAYLWSGGYLWSDSYPWSGAYLFDNSYLWSSGLTDTVSTNKWVDQQ
jgi:serine protease AprX